MKNKTMIITGGSQGIGRAIALRLSGPSMKIAITYAGNRSKAENVVTEIRAKGSEATALKLDLSDIHSVKSLFPAVEENFGKVDILVSNAYGKSIFKPLINMEEEDYDSMFSSTKGTFFLLQEAAKHLSDNGSVVAFSSGATAMPTPAGGTYAGSKAAIELFALGLAKELGDRKINVNVVSPGVTQTESLVAPQGLIDQLVAETPLGRLGTPEDIANAVAMLVNDNSKWINMQNVGINGGII